MTAKVANRFSEWQEARQARREAIISEYLSFLGKTRIKVRNLTDLAELVARHISQIEGKPCNKSTLLRNVRYKARLLTFQARSLASGTKALSSRTVTDPTAKALVACAELESENLKRELQRLNIYATALEKQVDQLQSRGWQPPSTAPESQTRLSDYEFRFIRTCQALRLLLNHLDRVVQIDLRSECILDMSKRRDNVIASKEVVAPFLEWLGAEGKLM